MSNGSDARAIRRSLELFEVFDSLQVGCHLQACNLSSQFPEVAPLATASKRIVLPLVLPSAGTISLTSH